MKIFVSLLFYCLFVTINSCNKRILVDKQYVVNKAKGIAIFIDKESRQFRNLGIGDVFTDSLIPDFFIPYNFTEKIIQKKDINRVFLKKRNKKISFFYLKGDCNEAERTSSIKEESLLITLDKNIDEYLQSNKIFVLPVEINYLKNGSNREYYDLHKSLVLEFRGEKIPFLFNSGYFDVLKMNVLQFDWTTQ